MTWRCRKCGNIALSEPMEMDEAPNCGTCGAHDWERDAEGVEAEMFTGPDDLANVLRVAGTIKRPPPEVN